MAKINLNNAAIAALNAILDTDVLENNIDLIESTIDDYLMDIPDKKEDAQLTLDKIASLRVVSKEFSNILKAIKNE